jgi:hypothetical protein
VARAFAGVQACRAGPHGGWMPIIS